MRVKFQAADVTKPLVAVKRITEKGNYLVFGLEDKDNSILNCKTGVRIPLRKNGWLIKMSVIDLQLHWRGYKN